MALARQKCDCEILCQNGEERERGEKEPEVRKHDSKTDGCRETVWQAAGWAALGLFTAIRQDLRWRLADAGDTLLLAGQTLGKGE